MKDENCIFCKIANGEIPTATIYEDTNVRVILDLNPATRGHALIIPKEHFADIYEITDEVSACIMPVAKRVVTKMTEIVNCDGYNIIQNNKEVAGQTVFHYHVHLIPRYKGDGVKLGWKMGTLSEEERDKIVNLMRE